MNTQPLHDLYDIQNELREPVTAEDLYATSEIHDSLTSGGFFERQAKAMQEMWGTVQSATAQKANQERTAKGLEMIDWPVKDLRPRVDGEL